jgi:hypothetical protein
MILGAIATIIGGIDGIIGTITIGIDERICLRSQLPGVMSRPLARVGAGSRHTMTSSIPPARSQEERLLKKRGSFFDQPMGQSSRAYPAEVISDSRVPG